MKPYNTINAIMEYQNAIFALDSSIVSRIYENDLIFIVAIDADKYRQFKKDINLISYNIHSVSDLEKEIVCMPNDFVSDWDVPVMYYSNLETSPTMYLKPDLEKENVCMPKDFVPDSNTPVAYSNLETGSTMYLKTDLESDWDIKPEMQFNLDESFYCHDSSKKQYELQSDKIGVANECSQAA